MIVLCVTGGSAQAIPVFARRYKTACTTCHVLPPQLNSFGQAFRANGFRMPAGEGKRQEADVQLGAPEWEGLFPNAFLPGTVSDSAPVAGLIYASVEADRGNVTTEETNLILGLLSAGNIGQRASWFAAGGFGPRGGAIERMWASVDRLAGPWLNVRAGYFEAAVVPLSRYTHKLSYEGYLPFEANGPAGLALSASRTAVEVYGAGSDPGPLRGLQFAAGVAARPAGGGLAADGYARLSYKLGGLAAAGDRSGEPGLLSPAVNPLEETSLRLGAYAYQATLGGPASRPRGWRAGGDADLYAGRFEAFATAWTGGDRLFEDGDESSTWAFLTGASVRPFPWLVAIGRYEASWVSGSEATRRLVATLRGALQQNAAVTIDLVVDMPHADSTETVASLFLAF
ncbi:MAG TPA: hypothetical protein VMK66_07400 [Myxococcales bacterium]|nr:hypothetical protein [Myxococcales bacterium]